EERDVAGVVQVRVCQDHCIERRGIERQGLPIPQPELFQALEEAAVDQNPPRADVDEVFRTGDRASRAQKCELHAAPSSASSISSTVSIVFTTASGLREMLSIPCRTRNRANSG